VSFARIREVITSKDEAERIADLLIKSSGWRERVVAAKIVTAYSLYDRAAPLVETFIAAQENYTAIAIAKMLKTLDAPGTNAALKRMIDSCPNSDYGNHLKQVIHDARPV
jgi:hypothetical protein